MSMQSVSPDAYLPPQGSSSVTIGEKPEWDALNPCPGCGAKPHDAPDGVHASGEPRWVFPHCWKCGFRPSAINTGADLAVLKQQFDALGQLLARQDAMQHRSLQPPATPEDADKLRALLAEYEAKQQPPTQ